MKFVSLHTHTTLSYGDGFGLPSEHLERVEELGMTAVAFTEHGNVSSHVKLEVEARKRGIKPIFGLEAYTAAPRSKRKWHLTLLAMDQLGYSNLTKLTTKSWEEGFYQWPTVHGDMLAQHNKGLIALSGCADSHLACQLLGGKGIEKGSKRAAETLLKNYLRIFGDRYYLEVQRFPQLERTCEINAQYAEWSRKFGIPMVATADVHYPLPEQRGIQEVLHAANRGHAVGESDWEYEIPLSYPLSDVEIMEDLYRTGLRTKEAAAAVAETARIAERCNVELPRMERVRYPMTEEDWKPWN